MVPGGKSAKYGMVRTERGSIHGDEPVFLIRAQDQCAIEALLAYQRIAFRMNASTEFVDSVNEAIQAFQGWDGSRKMPD